LQQTGILDDKGQRRTIEAPHKLLKALQ